VTPDPHDLIGAYATHALDDSERLQVEQHLAGCADCRAELAGFREVLGALTTRAVAPPAALEEAVMAAARGTSPAAASADSAARRGTEPLAPEREARTPAPRRPAAVLVAAAAAAAAFVLGGVLGRATAPEASVEASGSAGMDAVLAVAAAEDAAFLPADVMGADARVVISDEMGKVAFLASDLPTPAKGDCYQVWRVAPDGTKTSAGVFTPDTEGLVAVVLDAGPDTVSFVITTEPPGGSPKPTGDMVGQVGA
jgi:anti-sigma-K factor RskA